MSLVQHYINNGVNINKREKKITELCIFVDGFVITLTSTYGCGVQVSLSPKYTLFCFFCFFCVCVFAGLCVKSNAYKYTL